MSRSYRKPYAVEPKHCKNIFKRFANKRVRSSDISSGGNYKKEYCSYNICDYIKYYPEDEKLRRK